MIEDKEGEGKGPIGFRQHRVCRLLTVQWCVTAAL
jgi:hypothetical protein